MAKGQMVINYVPGEECRVAVVYDGKLHELHAERMDNASHVNNIYVGRVVNVEPAIQAAFVDFGLEQNGFLHVSDLHPQYFPDATDETTERVGKKTPRRDRPPIQECLRRGQEIAVQVLKEGVGTKGPTVTSYLSIPGRFLVMMPQMDRVGVSRKVEDEETRRKMREILDQLDLPDGFGFILRTAGMDRTKAELKRDLAYLSRLWKDMEKRWKSGNKPRLLYSESDLLVRALRDILSADIDEVVVDNEVALNRAGRFLKIVAPRSSIRLVHYRGQAPIFHALGLEEQIQMIHAREVPLPSGGRLVIDETEALVAIDVNSGKSRDARDAETNAYRTNLEAADEICRQLRLRDLGGVIINDLIDMRFSKHRREVENRFKELLKKDRARWTIAPISEFGILEMTRQRMRGSHESQHFADCPVCRGRGLVQRPDSVAADGLRELASILDHDRVHRVEMVVSPRTAGELLSTKRRALSRIERASGKHVDVRVSEAIPVDRVTFYAYDDRGADLDVEKLGKRKLRPDELVEYELPRATAGDDWAAEPEQAEPEPVEETAAEPEMELHPIEIEPEDGDEPRDGENREEGGRGRRRRRGRRGRGRNGQEAAGATGGGEGRKEERRPSAPPVRERAAANGRAGAPQAAPAEAGESDGEGGRRRRRRRRRGGRGRGGAPLEAGAAGAPSGGEGDMPGAPELDDHDGGSEEFESSDGGRLEVGAGAAGGDQDGPWAEDDAGQPVNGHAVEQPGEGGEGGGRRRRRRRRRGRGRGRGEGASGGETGGPREPSGMDQSTEDAGEPAGEWSEQPSEAAYGGAGDEAGDDLPGGPIHAEDEGDESELEPAPVGGAEGEGEGGERRGRRRRRRRGRGGRGGAEGGGESGGPGEPRGRAQRGGGMSDQPRSSEPQPSRGSTPPSSPARGQGGAGSQEGKKPRVLYSSRRRLAPGEKRPAAGDE